MVICGGHILGVSKKIIHFSIGNTLMNSMEIHKTQIYHYIWVIYGIYAFAYICIHLGHFVVYLRKVECLNIQCGPHTASAVTHLSTLSKR